MGRPKDELVKREQALVAAARLAGRQCVVCPEVMDFDDLEADLRGDAATSSAQDAVVGSSDEWSTLWTPAFQANLLQNNILRARASDSAHL